MRWHVDSTHMSKAAGDLVQDKIWGVAEVKVDDFGRKVNSSNVDVILENINASRENYIELFPDDVIEVAKSARKTSSKRAQP